MVMGDRQRLTVRVLRSRPSDQKIIGFDVAIDEVLVVNRLHA